MKTYEISLDNILDKIAEINPMSEQDFETICHVFQKKAQMNELAYFEKLAKEDEEEELDRIAEERIEKIASVKFQSVHNLKNGSFIVFPETRNKEVFLTPAIYFKELKAADFNSNIPGFSMVVANDGRIAILKNGDPFICMPVDKQTFKLHATGIKSLGRDDIFFAMKKNSACSPIKINEVYKITTVKDEWGYPIGTNSKDNYKSAGLIFKGFHETDKIKRYSGMVYIRTLKDTKFDSLSKDEYVSRKANEIAEPINSVKRSSRLSDSNGNSCICTDEDTTVFVVTGYITGYLKSQSDYERIHQYKDAGYDLDEITKMAAFTTLNTVNLTCINRKDNKFNLTIDYKDTDARMFKGRNLSFNNITKAKAKAILRIVGFQGMKVSEAIFKAKNEPNARLPLPATCTMEDIKKLEGGEMTNTSSKAIKDAIHEYADPYKIAKGIGVATTAGLLLGAGTAVAPSISTPVVATGLRVLGKIVNHAAESANEFEKLAQDHESEVFLDYAKSMVIAHNYLDKVATVINDNKNSYPALKDASLEVLKAKPVFEKMAYELTGYKVNQSLSGTETIRPVLISQAIENLDNLVKIASAVNGSMDIEMLNFMSKK